MFLLQKKKNKVKVKFNWSWKVYLNLNYLVYYYINCFICENVFSVTLTPKIDDVNSTTNQIPSNETNDSNMNMNMNIIQELPKTISPPVVVRMPSVIQPLVITSSNSSPLPSTPSLSISPLLQSPLESNIPNDFSFINTISNISSAPSDRPVHHTYVSSIKSQVRYIHFYIIFLLIHKSNCINNLYYLCF